MSERLQESPECVPEQADAVRVNPDDPTKGPVSQGQVSTWGKCQGAQITVMCRSMEAHVVKIRAIASESEAKTGAKKTERCNISRFFAAGRRKRIAKFGNYHATE